MRGRFIALVLYQGFPWYDEQMLKDETIATLASGGLNIVRLGAMWTGFEPEKGQINQSYVDILKVNQPGNLLGPEMMLVKVVLVTFIPSVARLFYLALLGCCLTTVLRALFPALSGHFKLKRLMRMSDIIHLLARGFLQMGSRSLHSSCDGTKQPALLAYFTVDNK